jgi:Skp family chaperone for outer membrane proteins
MTRITPLSLRLVAALALAAIVLTGTPPPPAHAQTPPMVIAIVDLQVILRDSKAAAGARVALDKQAKGFQADLAKQEDALKNEGQQLEQARASMAADDFRRKSEAFQQKVNAARQSAAARRQQMQLVEQNAMNQVQSALNSTVSDVAKTRNISLVLVKGAVLYNQPAFDITAEVLQKLDAKLPSVKLTAAK